MKSALGTPILCPVLIGRDLPLETLSRLIEQATGGVGHTVLIAGEAGIGKSRLVNEAKNRADKHGFHILQGSCFEPDQVLPYAPLLDLLRTFITNHSDTEITSAFNAIMPELVKLVPDLAARLPGIEPSSALEPEAEKRRLFDALARFFTGEAGSERTRLLIVIEDLHWCDNISLEFLLMLARRIVSKSILMVLTYRTDELTPALEHFLLELNRERISTEVLLQPLSQVEMDEMLRAIFETDRSMGDTFQQKLYALTEGNPFFVEETLKALAVSGSIFFERGEWNYQFDRGLHIPRSIKDVVRHRTELLSKEARHLLELASVAGRRFDFSLLQALTQLGEQELLIRVKELISAQLVVEESSDQFSFRHALTREAVYLSLLIRERKKYHKQAAEMLERLYAPSLDAQVSNLAYHYFEAGEWDKAFTFSQQAGEQAQALYAPHTAIEQFTRALEAARHLPISRFVLFRERGQLYETIGEFSRAQADYEQALNSAIMVHNSKAEWQALIKLGSLWSERDYRRTGDYFQQALNLARKMGDPASLAHSLNRNGNWHANVGDLDEALRLHQQALDIFQGLKDRGGLAETLDLLGMTSQINGDLVQGVLYYQRAVEIFHELDDRHGLVSSLATLCLCGPSYLHNPSFSLFSLSEAIEQGESALKLAQEIGWRAGEIYALHCLSICLGPQGAIQRAMELVQRSLVISEEIGHDQWLIGAHCDLGMLYLEAFALTQARQHLELAFTLAQEIGSSVWIGSVTGYLASVCILQGDLFRAEAVLDAEITANTPAKTQMQRLCWCARVELALARGEPDRALAIIDHLIASNPSDTPAASIPRLSQLRSEALIALKRPVEAERELQLAQAASFKQGARSLSWHIHLALGKLYQAQARRSEADAEFSAAKNIIEAISASIRDQTILKAFLAHTTTLLPIPAPIPPRRAGKEKFGGLTARECEVAALIAQGTSNRDIAEALVISERTVESHVTNILSKLDFTSRARIASWAVKSGLAI